MTRQVRVLVPVLFLVAAAAFAAESDKKALYGDLHVHTSYSFDAFIFGTLSTPDDAYHFAKGEAIDHPSGYELQLDRPLDFYAVTDHAMAMGMLRAMADPNSPMSKIEGHEILTEARTIPEKRRAFTSGLAIITPQYPKHMDVLRSAWQETIAAAERNNEPGKFTTFIAYEFTSARNGNLHRNVIFKGSDAPERPFSRVDSLNPEDLWNWMDELRGRGIEALAIPHNSNGSNGQMFDLETFDGDPLTPAWAEQRLRNEPLVEVTQVKGTSDTHPFLSPDDQWADFEIFPYQIASWNKSAPNGSYVREAFINGLRLEDQLGVNPYRFGLIGASDTHNGGGSFDESHFTGKVGIMDGTPQPRGSVPVAYDASGNIPGYAMWYFRLWSASGLTGVWAEENTRESIYAAFRSQDTFATTGPRIKVRLFAGYDLPGDVEALKAQGDWVAAVSQSGGLPQGSDLEARRRGAPRFVAWAMKDPMVGTPLQRLQIIKGWVENGQGHEKIYDVACSDGLVPAAGSTLCPDNGAKVDLSDCSISTDVGDTELMGVWTDPDFDPNERAVYYVRVLENPTCRWSTWDALRVGAEPRPDLAATIQERAWTSPIWVKPRR